MLYVHRMRPLVLNKYHEKTRDLIELGQSVSNGEAEETRQFRFQLRQILEKQMSDHGIHAWICPSAMDEAPLGLESTGSPIMNLPWTCAGLPVLSLPAGKGPQGLPLGLQVIGNFMKDEKMISLGQSIFNMMETHQ